MESDLKPYWSPLPNLGESPHFQACETVMAELNGFFYIFCESEIDPNTAAAAAASASSSASQSDSRRYDSYTAHVPARKRFSDLFAYELKTGIWRKLRPSRDSLDPVPRAHYTLTTVGNSIALFGGTHCCSYHNCAGLHKSKPCPFLPHLSSKTVEFYLNELYVLEFPSGPSVQPDSNRFEYRWRLPKCYRYDYTSLGSDAPGAKGREISSYAPVSASSASNGTMDISSSSSDPPLPWPRAYHVGISYLNRYCIYFCGHVAVKKFQRYLTDREWTSSIVVFDCHSERWLTADQLTVVNQEQALARSSHAVAVIRGALQSENLRHQNQSRSGADAEEKVRVLLSGGVFSFEERRAQVDKSFPISLVEVQLVQPPAPSS